MKTLVLAGALAFSALAHAQSYPARPVRLMIPFPPGGIDLPARIISMKMSENMGQQVVMDYRSGANGAIGCEVVARAAPDGYTLLYTTSNTHVVALFTTKNLPYDPVRDFTPISIANEGGMHLAVHPSNPANSLGELIEDARRNPGKVSFASTGVGSIFQLIGEELKQLTSVDMLHVPYKGTGPMAQAVVAGEVTMYFGSGSAFPLVKAGKVKLLAFMDSKRSPFVPELPAATESVPGFQKIPGWMAFFGPANMPAPLVSRIHGEVVKALAGADVRAKLADLGYTAIGNSPAEAAAAIRSDISLIGRIVKASGIQPE
jgi:tripartite-type tricarboxylate transporter receptor subunit TctC